MTLFRAHFKCFLFTLFQFLSALCPIFKFLSILRHNLILLIVYGCDIYLNNLTRLMNGNGAQTHVFMTMVQDFEVEKYNLVQEIFVKYSKRSRKFC